MKVLTLKGIRKTREEFQVMMAEQQRLLQNTQDAILKIEGALVLLDSFIVTMEKPEVKEEASGKEGRDGAEVGE